MILQNLSISKLKEENILSPQEKRLNNDFQLSRAVDLIKGLDIYRESLTQ